MAVMALPNKVDSPGRSSAPLDAGRRVLRIEAEALSALADTLDGSFERAVSSGWGDTSVATGAAATSSSILSSVLTSLTRPPPCTQISS